MQTEEDEAIATEVVAMVAACFKAGCEERGLDPTEYGFIVGVWTPTMSELECTVGTNAPTTTVLARMLFDMGAQAALSFMAGDSDGTPEDHST